MREIRMSGLMSGDGKRGERRTAQATAPVLDSTLSKEERFWGIGLCETFYWIFSITTRYPLSHTDAGVKADGHVCLEAGR